MGTNEDVERITSPDLHALKEEHGNSEMKYHARTKSSANTYLALRGAVWASLLMILTMQGVEAVESQAVHSSSSSLNSVNRSLQRTRVMGIVACGSFGGCKRDGEDIYQDAVDRNDKDEKAGVRCCTDKRKNGWEKKKDCKVWATSPSVPFCYPDATYADAFGICGQNGDRLCTATEVYENCAQGTGCNLDRKMIWTSSTNFHTEHPSWSPSLFLSDHPSAAPSWYSVAPSSKPTLSANPSHSISPSSVPSVSTNPTSFPSAHPSTDSVIIACGSDSEECKVNQREVFADREAEAAVRCCRDNFVNGWYKNTDEPLCKNTWAFTPSNNNCSRGRNRSFSEAREICEEDEGGRLCTSGEVINNCTKKPGTNVCGLDGEYIWTSSTEEYSESPTATPSLEPSHSEPPSLLPTYPPTYPPTDFPTASATQCTDFAGNFYYNENGKTKSNTCKWLRYTAPNALLSVVCKQRTLINAPYNARVASEQCPNLCDVCSSEPSKMPSQFPSLFPTKIESNSPSIQPTSMPTSNPSSTPTISPSSYPITPPSSSPSRSPTKEPSSGPSVRICTEDPNAVFFLREDTDGTPILKICSWLDGNPYMKKICEERTDSWIDGTPPAREICLNTCRNCLYSYTPSMSKVPSQQPSNIESPHPSLSPSKQPTKSPTQQPTYSPTLCTEDPRAVFFLKIKVEDLSEEFQSCEWLRNDNTARTITQICNNRKASERGIAPARIVCRDTCKMCIPSEHPSSIPSLTLIPSSRPSDDPTSQPTGTPTQRPSPHPTGVPSLTFSMSPTSQPTSFPTNSPSASPTKSPTSVPSLPPTKIPTSSPSMQPTEKPSSVPSSSPTSSPTGRPSTDPSTQPSMVPSPSPSSLPTGRPTSQPFIGATWKPSITKSDSPTSTPSEVTNNPSSSPINSLKIVGSDSLVTKLELSNSSNLVPMNEEARGEFEDVLGARVKKQLDDQFNDSFEVDAAVISTENTRSRGRTRNLQADRTGLDVVTELTTRTRSNEIYTSDDIKKAALRAFDSNIKLQNFLSELKSRDPSFESVSSLDVKEVSSSGPIVDDGETGLSTWGIAAISLGSAAVIFGAFLVATSCRKRDRGLGHLPVSSADDFSSNANIADVMSPVAVEPIVTSPMNMPEPSTDNGSSPRKSNPYKLHQQHLDISSMQSSAYDDGSSRTGDSGFTSGHRSDFNSEMSSRADNSRNDSSSYTRSMYDSRRGGVYDSRSGSISYQTADSSENKRHDKNHLNPRDMPATILEENGGLSIASSSDSRSKKQASEKDASRSERSASRSRSRSRRRSHSRDGESRGSSSRRSRSTKRSDIKDGISQSSSKSRSRSSRGVRHRDEESEESSSRRSRSTGRSDTKDSVSKQSSTSRSRSTGRLERSDAHAIGSRSPSRRSRSRSSGRSGARSSAPRERSRSSGRGVNQDDSSRGTSRRRSRSSGRHDTRARGSSSRDTPRSRARSSGRADTGDSTSRSTSTTRARSVGPSDKRGASRSSSRRRTRSSERSKASHSSERNERNSSRTRTRSSGRSNTRDITLPGNSTQRRSSRTRERSSGRSSARSTTQTSGRSSSTSRKSGEESRHQRSRSKSRSKKEKTIEIIVTPGKLGFIIDAPLDGHPVVHSVKETSILGDRIMVGDKLLSIDGQEMLGLTSIEISKIIKEKANNPKRVMVFQRPPRESAE